MITSRPEEQDGGVTKASVSRFLEAQGVSETSMQASLAGFDVAKSNGTLPTFWQQLQARYGKGAGANKAMGADAHVQTKAAQPAPQKPVPQKPAPQQQQKAPSLSNPQPGK